MKVAIRTDASSLIGSGHAMRCLTLANAISQEGAKCYFICRDQSGSMSNFIRQKGYTVYDLPTTNPNQHDFGYRAEMPEHARWLGCSWETDAFETSLIVQALKPDWLVVDHYAIDENWERTLRPYCRRLMVIDDLADRRHDCDLLLDQTVARTRRDYQELVPSHCALLTGAHFALLRPEFSKLRSFSLTRRSPPQLEHLMVSMGGVDSQNATGRTLRSMRTCRLPGLRHITVVMGSQAPWLQDVMYVAKTMPWTTEVFVDVENMAQLMAGCDLAIGAAGSTMWERCCLGLPSLVVVLAKNQLHAASTMDRLNAVINLGAVEAIETSVPTTVTKLCFNLSRLKEMSAESSLITDGQGTVSVINVMLAIFDVPRQS